MNYNVHYFEGRNTNENFKNDVPQRLRFQKLQFFSGHVFAKSVFCPKFLIDSRVCISSGKN